MLLSGLVALFTGLSAASVGINFPEEGGGFTWSRKFGYPTLGFVAGCSYLGKGIVSTIVHFDALQLEEDKRLVRPVVSWLGLAGCFALFISLPVWALVTGFGTLALVTMLRYVVRRWKGPASAATH